MVTTTTVERPREHEIALANGNGATALQAFGNNGGGFLSCNPLHFQLHGLAFSFLVNIFTKNNRKWYEVNRK